MNFNSRELSLSNPFSGTSAEIVAQQRWESLGKTLAEQAVDIVRGYLTGTSENFRRTGVVHNWNDYVKASQEGMVRLPTNPSWRVNKF